MLIHSILFKPVKENFPILSFSWGKIYPQAGNIQSSVKYFNEIHSSRAQSCFLSNFFFSDCYECAESPLGHIVYTVLPRQIYKPQYSSYFQRCDDGLFKNSAVFASEDTNSAVLFTRAHILPNPVCKVCF